MSHELRTPLNAIFGWITLLRTRRLDEATQARALETIERNARAQKRLIEDLLDVSRIVTGKMPSSWATSIPRRVVEAALDTMQPAAQAKEVSIVPPLGEMTGTVRGDSARLQQVVCNLLSNAIKFTPPGGRIDVELGAERRSGADQRHGHRPGHQGRNSCRMCSIASARRTARSAAATAASGWGSRSCATWWSCIRARSKPRATARAAARASSYGCRRVDAYGTSTVEPVVRRPSRSRCACAASASA